jgi:hypothetical protein
MLPTLIPTGVALTTVNIEYQIDKNTGSWDPAPAWKAASGANSETGLAVGFKLKVRATCIVPGTSTTTQTLRNIIFTATTDAATQAAGVYPSTSFPGLVSATIGPLSYGYSMSRVQGLTLTEPGGTNSDSTYEWKTGIDAITGESTYVRARNYIQRTTDFNLNI